jgi:hypothetical protein
MKSDLKSLSVQTTARVAFAQIAIAIGFLYCTQGDAASPFGTFSVMRDGYDEKLAGAEWDRGTIRIDRVVQNGSGGFSWAENIDWGSMWAGTGLGNIPNDRNWVVWINSLPSWLRANSWEQTPNNWDTYYNLIKWVCGQLPSQVKVIEVANEKIWWVDDKIGFPDKASMAEYIKRTNWAVRASSRSNLIIAGPTWVFPDAYARDRFNELMDYQWSDGSRVINYLDAFSMHNYTGEYNPTTDQVKKFEDWIKDLDDWYGNLGIKGWLNKAHYWTEFGWSIANSDSRKTVSQENQARFISRGYSALKSKGANIALAFCMIPLDFNYNLDYALLNRDQTKRSSYWTANFATQWLNNVGTGVHTKSTNRHTIDFGARMVVWDSSSAYAYNTGSSLVEAKDMYGNAVTITNGNTVNIGQSPVYLIKNLSRNYRIKCKWGGKYLATTGSTSGSNVATSDYNANSASIKWSLERVSGTQDVYRIKNLSGNNYLRATGTEVGSNIDSYSYNADWWSERWRVEKVPNDPGVYRIYCMWAPNMYVQATGDQSGANVNITGYNADWWSSRWTLEPF